ncbi:hypothetical protein BH09PAT1_BH09PAT1_2490 [soil metagenome]
MEFNRLVSLVLGFVVLILVFVWISNRFRATTRSAQSRTPTITPTYTPTPSTTQTSASRWNPLSFLTRKSEVTPIVVARTVSPSPTAIKVKIETTGIIAKAATVTVSKNAPTQQPTKPMATNSPIKQPTKKQNPSPTKIQMQQASKTYVNNKTGKKIAIAEIPETGAPSALLPVMMAALSGGIYLRRKV